MSRILFLAFISLGCAGSFVVGSELEPESVMPNEEQQIAKIEKEVMDGDTDWEKLSTISAYYGNQFGEMLAPIKHLIDRGHEVDSVLTKLNDELGQLKDAALTEEILQERTLIEDQIKSCKDERAQIRKNMRAIIDVERACEYGKKAIKYLQFCLDRLDKKTA